MSHIQISGVAGELKSRLDSSGGLPIKDIEKYSDSSMTVVNEDNVQEYIEASSRGQEDEYMEYLEDDSSVSQETVEAAQSIDVDNSITERELKQKIDQEINNIYSKQNIQKVSDKLQEDINKAIRENNLQDRIPSGVVSSVSRLTDIMKKIVTYAGSTVFFLGVAGSTVISEFGGYMAGIGIFMIIALPLALGLSVYTGTPMLGLKAVAAVAAYIVGGKATEIGFGSIAKTMDSLYMAKTS